MCELCGNEPVLRSVVLWRKPNGQPVWLELGVKCILKLLGD
jgi:hypothetical protein